MRRSDADDWPGIEDLSAERVDEMLLGWVIRVLLLALVLRIVVSFVRGLSSGFGSPRPTVGRGARQGRKSVSLVRDPVCGTYVEPSHAVSARTGSAVHYFCSDACRQTFRLGVSLEDTR